jgi:hypothetical protein
MFNPIYWEDNMKKFMAAFAIVAMASFANATDRTGELGIGYQTSLGAGNTTGQWSVKYGLAANSSIQGIIGFDLSDADDSTRLSVGARYLYDIVEMENSEFYTGLGVVYHWAGDAFTQGPGASFDEDGLLTINAPLGFSFTLANAPAVEFSAEMGLTFNYAIAAETWTLNSIGGGNGAVFNAGAHYYF